MLTLFQRKFPLAFIFSSVDLINTKVVYQTTLCMYGMYGMLIATIIVTFIPLLALPSLIFLIMVTDVFYSIVHAYIPD
ncbi:hypothetical protein BDF20DRAFT_883942 [Mycotypha africana]|uniref:uncharacterized protein n=1 Tax=Mycotypha africana TaxID=64632 RepID=UPI002300B9C7|nr:uncharacterized protein BDF20DRAFT_883942 [Mycotypha africana]KAI8973763.1 hypothetical protein BDF20DRAFT_883942 [Mycotypha africana]